MTDAPMEVTEYYRADLTPSVKPLEWMDCGAARNGLGTIYAVDGTVPNLILRRYEDLNDTVLATSESLEGLREIANRDNEKRILSALNFTPSDKDKEIERLREALTPSGSTKEAYIGEFSFSVKRLDEDGNEYSEMIDVPWTTIKDIMAAIAARAALEERG